MSFRSFWLGLCFGGVYFSWGLCFGGFGGEGRAVGSERRMGGWEDGISFVGGVGLF